MKRRRTAWIGLAAALLAAAGWLGARAFAAADAGFAPAAEFEKAKQAYDAGRMDESIRLYEEIAARGYRAPGLSFNLGNAYFRQGKTALAVLQYRTAWRGAPRDPDVAANLAFALQTAGAPAPGTPMAHRLLRKVSRGEWAVVAAAGFWLSCALCGVLIWRRFAGEVLRRLLAVSAVALLAGLAGLLEWRSLDRQPEAVVKQPGQNARFAPLQNSTVYFALPPGSIVRVEERAEGWIKVAVEGKSGWLPESACVAVRDEG